MLAVGRRITIDRLDSCPESVLGLGATCCCTCWLWIVLVPLFDWIGVGWVRSWENKNGVVYPEIENKKCIDGYKHYYTTPGQAFAALDKNNDSEATEDEWRTWAADLNNRLTKDGFPTILTMSCFQNLDANRDGSALQENEFYQNIGDGDKYNWPSSSTASKVRQELVGKYGSMEEACKKMDSNNDTAININEFKAAVANLTNAPKGDKELWRLFSHFDKDDDGLIQRDEECNFNAKILKERLRTTYGNVTTGCRMLDANGDGMISNAEFVTGTSVLTPPLTEADANYVFKSMDADKDGGVSVVPDCYVDQGEMQKRIQASGDPLAIFKAADADKNGVLSAEEYVAAGKNLSKPVDDADLKDLVKVIDVDQSGDFDFGEFLTPTAVAGSFALEGAFGNKPPNKTDIEGALSKAVAKHPKDTIRAVVTPSSESSRRLASGGQITAGSKGPAMVSEDVVWNITVTNASRLNASVTHFQNLMKNTSIEQKTFLEALAASGFKAKSVRSISTAECSGPMCSEMQRAAVAQPGPKPGDATRQTTTTGRPFNNSAVAGTFANADVNGDGYINTTEFGRLSKSGLLKQGVTFQKVDTDKNNGINMQELKAAEQRGDVYQVTGAPPPGSESTTAAPDQSTTNAGAAGGAAQGATTTAKASTTVGEAALTALEEEKYNAIPAMVSGHTELYFKPTGATSWPSATQMGNQVRPNFETGVTSYMHVSVSVQAVTKGAPNPAITNGVQLNLTWQGDLTDGGKFQRTVKAEGKQLTNSIVNQIKNAHIPWLASTTEIGLFSVMTFTYTSADAAVKAGLPKGTTIMQRFGTKNGKSSSDGSDPFVKVLPGVTS